MCVRNLHSTDEICSVELQNAMQSSTKVSTYAQRIHTHTHTHTHAHAHPYTRTCTCMHTHTHTRTHTHTHTHTTQHQSMLQCYNTLKQARFLSMQQPFPFTTHSRSPCKVYTNRRFPQTSACEVGGAWEDAITTSRLHPIANEHTWGTHTSFRVNI